MFDRILIRREPADAGMIVEACLFYGDVHVLVGPSSLGQIAHTLGPHTLLTLLEEGHVRVTYTRDVLVVRTFGDQRGEYDLQSVRKLGPGGTEIEPSDLVAQDFVRFGATEAHARRLAARFLEVARLVDLADEADHPNGIPGMVRDQLLGDAHSGAELARILQATVPTYDASRVRMNLVRTSRGFRVEPNINLNPVTQHRTLDGGVPKMSSLVGSYLESYANMFLASKYDSELLLSPTQSAILSAHCEQLLARQRSTAALSLFQSVVMPTGRAIREAVNAGECDLGKLTQILGRRSRFRDWLAGKPHDADLLREYNEAITGSTWAEKLPAKSIRFVLFTGLGVGAEILLPTGVGTAAGVSFGVADFILDQLAGGWKPDQFVQHDLARLGKKP